MEALIDFGDGDETTNKEALTTVEGFLRAGKQGIDRERQFENLRDWHLELWKQAIHRDVWGYPSRPFMRKVYSAVITEASYPYRQWRSYPR
jgi:hypothetical protein